MKSDIIYKILDLVLDCHLRFLTWFLFAGTLSVESANTGDIAREIYDRYLDGVASMSPPVYWTIIRLFVALGLSAGTCALSYFRFGSRLIPVQLACCLLGFFIAMEAPIEIPRLGRTGRGWLFAFALLGDATLPWALAWLVVNKAGWRIFVAIVFYGALLVLLILSLRRD